MILLSQKMLNGCGLVLSWETFPYLMYLVVHLDLMILYASGDRKASSMELLPGNPHQHPV